MNLKQIFCISKKVSEMEELLTQVPTLDSTVVKRDAQIVACFPQLRYRDSIRAADYPCFIVILPVKERSDNTNGIKKLNQLNTQFSKS